MWIPGADHRRIANVLRMPGVDRADAEILVAAVLSRPRAWVFAHPERELTPDQVAACSAALERRRGGEPVAFITGSKEFYGRPFAVSRSTLIPRPSTEGLVDLVLSLYKKSVQLEGDRWHAIPIDEGIVAALYVRESLPPFAVDIGTGCGCIAVTLAAERKNLEVLASDISNAALEIARANAQTHGVRDRVRFALADGPAIFAELSSPFFVISNPPYIPNGTRLPEDVAHFEPHAALFAGADGLDVLRPLVASALAHPLCAGVAVECRAEQATTFAEG